VSSPLSVRILDAAAELVARHGIRRVSMDDVARLAGCARPTIYKHYPTKDALLGAVFLREVARYLDSIEATLAATPASAHSLENLFVHTLRYIREHAMIRGILLAEPEALLPLLRGSGGPILGTIADAVAGLVEREMRRGVLRRTDPRLAAEAFIRFVLSLILIPRVALDLDDERNARRLFRESLLAGLAAGGSGSRGGPGRKRARAGARSRRSEKA